MADRQDFLAETAEIQGRTAAVKYILKDAFARAGQPIYENVLLSQTEALTGGGAAADGFTLNFALDFHLAYHGPRGKGFKRTRHIGVVIANGNDAHLDRKKAICERNGISAKFIDVTAADFDIEKAAKDTLTWYELQLSRPEE